MPPPPTPPPHGLQSIPGTSRSLGGLPSSGKAVVSRANAPSPLPERNAPFGRTITYKERALICREHARKCNLSLVPVKSSQRRLARQRQQATHAADGRADLVDGDVADGIGEPRDGEGEEPATHCALGVYVVWRWLGGAIWALWPGFSLREAPGVGLMVHES